MTGIPVVLVPREGVAAVVGQRLTAYDLLGVSPEASTAEITSAYRGLLRRYHPDSRDATHVRDAVDHDLGTDAAGALRMIIEAYEVLRDPRRRADYDRRQEVQTPVRSSFPTGEEQGFILRAGPVRWNDERASTSSVGQPTVTDQELELMKQLVRILHRRWDYR